MNVNNTKNPCNSIPPGSASGSDSSTVSSKIISIKNVVDIPVEAKRLPELSTSGGECKIKIANDKYHLLKVSASKNTMEASRDVMFITRAIFGRDKKLKTPNKINTNNRTFAEWKHANNYLITSRSVFDDQAACCSNRYTSNGLFVAPHMIGLSFRMKKSAGQCGEMMTVTYALLDQLKLNPELIEYKLSKDFNHHVCAINIKGECFIIDPWANLICEHEEYLAKLSGKVEKWKKEGKYIPVSVSGSDDIYKGNITAANHIAPEDLSKMKISYRGVHPERSQINTPYMFQVIEEILSGKP